MAGNIQNVSFASPQALIAPDIAAQQQQLQRNLALAQALRQESLQDTQGNGGNVSWTQGLSRLADALISKRMYKQADQQTADMSRQYAGALRSMFGASGGAAPVAPSPAAQAPAAPAPMAAAPQGSPNWGSGGADDPGNLTPPAPPVSAPAPVGGAPAASAPPSPAPQAGPTPGPMSLTGNPGQDMMMYSLNPDEYTKALISAHAPVDMAKTIAQARQAMNSGDMATASALLASVDKQNYIAPVNGRPGSIIRDPHDPSKVLALDPQSIEGANPVIGPDGKWTGAYSQAPGAADAIGAAARAKAVGNAAGSLTQVFDPATNQMVYKPTSALLPGGAPGGGGGGLNTMFGGGGGAPAGGGNAAGAPLGAGKGADQDAQNSANQFNAIIGGAQGSQDRAYGLQKIGDLAKGLPTGAGAVDISEAKSGVNSVAGALGFGPIFNNESIGKVQEIQKLASSIAQQQSASLGGNGATDAKLSAAFASLPDARKAPGAIQDITTYLQANERAIQAKSAAAAAWKAAHGAGDFSSFASAWQRAYDPRIFQWMQQGPAAVRKGMASLSPAERQALTAKSNQLAAMGAFAQ